MHAITPDNANKLAVEVRWAAGVAVHACDPSTGEAGTFQKW